jgi:dethiobiotin synthetase
LEIVITGTDTGIGKTSVVLLLAAGLRARGRRVWLHKPVACGDWRDGQADDGRALGAARDREQDAAGVCPFQFPAAAAPHLAARATGQALPFAALVANLAAIRGRHDLLVEGAGGLLAPLADDRRTLADLVAPTGLPLLIVTRPDLGTLNHTALTVACARARRLPVLGLIVNRARPVEPGLATDHAVSELAAHCGVPVLADLAHGPTSEATAVALADAVISAHHPGPQ